MLTFGSAFRADSGKDVGRVTVVVLPNAEAMIICVEWGDEGEALGLCRARADDGYVARQTITINNATGSINFPQMAHRDGVIYLA